jgi:hypothetical protein
MPSPIWNALDASPSRHNSRSAVLFVVLNPTSTPVLRKNDHLCFKEQLRAPPTANQRARKFWSQLWSVGSDHRSVDDMLGDEPHLQFVGPNHIADDQIVGALIVALCSDTRHCPSFFQNDFVRMKKP